jgi:uncharacterized protein (TIGR03066 family)
MRIIIVLTLGCLLLGLTGCNTRKLKDRIIGKWEPVESKTKDTPALEYTPDGKVILSQGTKSLTGSYKVLDENTIEVEFPTPEGKPPLKDKVTVKFLGDTMTTTDHSSQKASKFKRVP